MYSQPAENPDLRCFDGVCSTVDCDSREDEASELLPSSSRSCLQQRPSQGQALRVLLIASSRSQPEHCMWPKYLCACACVSPHAFCVKQSVAVYHASALWGKHCTRHSRYVFWLGCMCLLAATASSLKMHVQYTTRHSRCLLGWLHVSLHQLPEDACPIHHSTQ